MPPLRDRSMASKTSAANGLAGFSASGCALPALLLEFVPPLLERCEQGEELGLRYDLVLRPFPDDLHQGGDPCPEGLCEPVRWIQ